MCCAHLWVFGLVAGGGWVVGVSPLLYPALAWALVVPLLLPAPMLLGVRSVLCLARAWAPGVPVSRWCWVFVGGVSWCVGGGVWRAPGVPFGLPKLLGWASLCAVSVGVVHSRGAPAFPLVLCCGGAYTGVLL